MNRKGFLQQWMRLEADCSACVARHSVRVIKRYGIENHKDTKSTKILIISLCSLCLCGFPSPDLRRSHKHLDYIIVEIVEELPLKGPGEALVFQLAGCDEETIGIGYAFDFEPYQDFYPFVYFL